MMNKYLWKLIHPIIVLNKYKWKCIRTVTSGFGVRFSPLPTRRSAPSPPVMQHPNTCRAAAHNPSWNVSKAVAVVTEDVFDFPLKFKFPGNVGMLQRKETIIWKLDVTAFVLWPHYFAFADNCQQCYPSNIKFNIKNVRSYHDLW